MERVVTDGRPEVTVPILPEGRGLRLVIEREALVQTVREVLPVVRRKAVLELLRNVLLVAEAGGRLRIEATNLEVGVAAWARPAAAGEPGAVSVPAHMLAELAGMLPEAHLTLAARPGAFTGADPVVEVCCLGYRARLKGRLAEEFPERKWPVGQVMRMPAEQLAGMLRQVGHFMAHDENTPILAGVLFQVREGRLTLVATNRHCLALTAEGLDLPDMEVVVPGEAVGVLLRHLKGSEPVEVTLSERQVGFRLPDFEIVTRLPEGRYPDYMKVLPGGYATQAVVERAALLELVEAALRFGREEAGLTRMEIRGDGSGEGRVTVWAEAEAIGDYRGQVEAMVTGEGVKLRFIGEQLVKGLRALPEEEIRVDVPAEGPVVFWAGACKQVIVPMA